MTHKTSVNLQIHGEKHHKKHRATRIPKRAANPGLFLCQNCRDEMYNEVPSNPKCPTLKMTKELNDIDKPNSSPCL